MVKLPLTVLVENTATGSVLEGADRFHSIEIVFERERTRTLKWERVDEVIARAEAFAKRAAYRHGNYLVLDADGNEVPSSTVPTA
jgi:hypothetical protein